MEHVAQIAKESGVAPEFCALAPSFALAWAECGFPMVEPSHRLAASMMATSMPREHVDEFVRMPWRCFAIHCPAGLIDDEAAYVIAIKGRDHDHDRIRSLTFVGMHMHFGDESSIADWNVKFDDGFKIGDETIERTDSRYSEARSAFNKTELLGRLFVSVCAELSNLQISTGAGGAARSKGRNQNEPRCSTYKLTRNVRADVRSAVREYANGRSSGTPSVQVMVRGHWKSQPHGPARSERKLIHVEPYWRGPEDAPIGIRSHTLGGRT